MNIKSDLKNNVKAKGFVLTRQWPVVDGQQSLVYWLATELGPLKVEFPKQTSVFFIKSSDLVLATRLLRSVKAWHHKDIKLKNFSDDAVVACYFVKQQDLIDARQKLRHRVVIYEGDIRPTDRFLMERFVTAGLELEGVIEQESNHSVMINPMLKPAVFKPKLSVVSIDIETSYTENILYSIALQSVDENKVFMVGEGESALAYLECLPDEVSVINRFIEWIICFDPDILIGWNVVGFDFSFLHARCLALGISLNIGRMGEAMAVRTVTGNNGREKSYVLIAGRVALDGIELLRSATYQFESFSLEFVSRQILGRGKLIDDVDDRAEEIQDLFRTDKEQLARYNLEDCLLVSEIFEKTNLLDFAIERSRLTGLDMDRVGGSVAAFDYLYLPRLHRQGYIAPPSDHESEGASPGGFVLDSKPGIYDHVIVLDFKSLYPSIIRTFNVDPLALNYSPEGEHEDRIPGFKGATFSRNKGILPGIIKALWSARDVAKSENEQVMSQAIKIIMNSFYGVLGTPGCRFFDPKLVSSITMRGHEILQKTRDLLEARGLSVIYGDTDSVFVLLKDVLSDEDVNRRGLEEKNYLNNWWCTYLKETYAVDSCLELEFETHFERFLMPTVRGSEVGSKKRYAGLVRKGETSELIFKGLETVRSDWSPLAREFQQKLYALIFSDKPYVDFIKSTIENVLSGNSDHKLILRKRLRRRLDEYQKNVPPHVKAARIAERQRLKKGLRPLLGYGGWIEYIMTVNGAEPKGYIESEIDYQFYVDKQLAPIADSILFFKSDSLAQITDMQLGLF